MKPEKSVLVVDALEETREVLRAALERAGIDVYATDEPEDGTTWADEHQPDLIVLDLECHPAAEAMSRGFAQRDGAESSPLILLGTARRAAGNVPADRFVAKPYHYGPLIRKIEALLAEPAPLPK